MFVKVAIAAAPWGKINSTIGVSRVVSLDGKPKPLPSQLVSNLMLRCDVSGVLPPKTLNAGDSIEVLKGHLLILLQRLKQSMQGNVCGF